MGIKKLDYVEIYNIIIDKLKLKKENFRPNIKKEIEELKPIDLAKENIDHHSIFTYQLGRINYLNKNFEQAEKHFRSFIKKAEDNKESIPETILTFTVSLLIESMFEQGKYEDIIKMSFNINSYIKNRKDLNENIAIIHAYIGISLLNVGNIEDGIFYLIKSKRNTQNMNQVDFIDGILKNASNYL